jgi:hypothetical protein
MRMDNDFDVDVRTVFYGRNCSKMLAQNVGIPVLRCRVSHKTRPQL